MTFVALGDCRCEAHAGVLAVILGVVYGASGDLSRDLLQLAVVCCRQSRCHDGSRPSLEQLLQHKDSKRHAGLAGPQPARFLSGRDQRCVPDKDACTIMAGERVVALGVSGDDGSLAVSVFSEWSTPPAGDLHNMQRSP